MRLPDLLMERDELAATERSNAKILKKYARYEVLVLDEWLTEDVNDVDISFLFELIEPIFRRHDGRPHWGKLHSLHGQQLQALYPRWDDFLDLRRRLDPDGRLLNPYLKGLFGLQNA